MLQPAEPPPSAELLRARHRAHRAELRGAVADLPLEPGDTVLDVPCGDGFFTGCLAQRAGERGRVTAADLSPAMLRWAYDPEGEQPGTAPVDFVLADAAKLPYGDGCFDRVWCAHSLISLPDPGVALAEMARVARPGGWVAVLENDVVHDVLLPWPAELELAICRAERAAYRVRNRRPARLHVGRWLSELVAEAGLRGDRRTTYTVDRMAPLNPEDRRFLTLYLQAVWDRVQGFLGVQHRRQLAGLVDPQGESFLPDQPHFAMTCLDVLTLGRVPGD